MNLPVRCVAVLATLLACTTWSAPAGAHPVARIDATLAPEHLGAATTVSLAFKLSADGRVPAPLTGMSIVYPRSLGFATSGLGLAVCQPGAVETFGTEACPANSKLGDGSAVVAIPIGPTVVKEHVALSVFAGPSPDGYLHILVVATGKEPVEARVVLAGVLLPGRLKIVIPPIPSLPEAPYVAVVRMHITLGGRLTYYRRVAGASLAYHPPGVGLPTSCPRGGFSFAANFLFVDGSRSGASTAVPCPTH